jgi:hypothetical protein
VHFQIRGKSGGIEERAAGKTVLVRSISMGQDPRGFVHGPARPDYVRLDDIQSRQRARIRKFVRGSVDRITRDLIPALAENYSCVIVATPLNTAPKQTRSTLVTRIEETLSAPIENGVIRFLKTDGDQKELIDQLLQFPDGEYVDGPDALEGVVRKDNAPLITPPDAPTS